MKKYWFGLIILTIITLLFIYKEYIYLSEKVYVIYKKDDNFYKNKYEDLFYYKKEGEVLQLASFENKKKIHESFQKIKSLNIITIDSLSKILPLNFYMTHLLDKKRLDRLKKLRIFLIDIDSTRKKINIKEVYQTFREE